jgi:hypothetical protein
MQSVEHLSNTEKVVMYALIGDAIQSANGLRYQIQNIQEALKNPENLKGSMEWLNMINYGLEKMRKALDEVTDWKAMEGTDWQPER